MVITLGVVLGSIMVARNQSPASNTVTDTTFMDNIVNQLFQYAQRNNRLPCPDGNGDGYEDASNGVCAADLKTGGVPYATLNITLSSPIGTGVDRSFVYSVYRGTGANATDLTLAAERSLPTPHAANNASYMNGDDFKQAVINAQAASTTGAEVYVTGNDSNSGSSDCIGNRLANMAFVVAYAGKLNADGQGSDFDGVNLPGAGWNANNKWVSAKAVTCFAGPGKVSTPTYDDQVRAVGFLELLGVLNR